MNMTEQEKVAAKKISRIMRAARKQLALTQEQVAKKLGISQSALSKLEHGTLVASAPQWFDFCELTGIPADSLKSGYIDLETKAVVEDGNRKGTFKLPRKYANNRTVKIRELLPVMRFIEVQFGEDKLLDFFRISKMDEDFFIHLDNQVNLDFRIDLFKFLAQQGVSLPESMLMIAAGAGRPDGHGNFRRKLDGLKQPADFVKTWVQSSRLYNCDLNYKIENESASYIDVSITPESTFPTEKLTSDPAMTQVLCEYVRSYIESLARYGTDLEKLKSAGKKVKQLESLQLGHNRGLYRLELP
ncbi:MAG: helix-turn-helix transcriptional regulator [Bdellovibrionales bacterium]|nr:helix-turn-helix transcriptional regulator [Bdellovibrionales bacterium]